jgi:hypothetical protein
MTPGDRRPEPSLRDALLRALPYNNRRTTAPPGRLVKGPGTPVIIASLMRSGTHLLIDLILNNFRDFKKSPLYVELDSYLDQGCPAETLFSCGRRLLKTHFPEQTHASRDAEIIRRLAERSLIISPHRDPEDVYRSTAAFGYPMDRATFLERRRRFEEFWKDFPRLILPFEDLVRSGDYPARLRDIAAFLGVSPNRRTIGPPPGAGLARVYVLKAMTRCLGSRAPVVNTTIRFRAASRKAE